MKKSVQYIYPRSVPARRRSWKWFALVVCVAAACLFLTAHDHGVNQGHSPAWEETSVADFSSPMPGKEAEEKCLAVVSMPADAGGQERSDSSAMAVAAPLVEETAPQREGLLLATLGDGFSRLRHLPFFLPGPEEQTETFSESEVADAIAEEEGRQVYEKNPRYEVVDNGAGELVFCSSVARGDTAGGLLNEWLDAADVYNAVQAAEPVCPLSSIREGQPFQVTQRADNGEFVRFAYEMDTRRCLILERGDSGFTASVETIAYDTELVSVRGEITSSLFEAVAETGEGPALAVNLADVFSCEINFINEIREGDYFEVLVEKLYRDGECKGYGRMLAARFTNQGKLYEAYLFSDSKGRLRHYNAQGEALQKALLKAPLAFTKVSSGYSMARKHPVFGNVRPHQGVDYAALAGTPIKAVGEGVVTRVGWGDGYGNMVVIKHAGGLESQYAHMSKFARGIKKGVRVKQGQIIGYVGSTGVATGPHLDFRLRQNGKFINPARVIVPREAPVSKQRMAEFQRSVALSRAYLDGQIELAEYTPPEWIEEM